MNFTSFKSYLISKNYLVGSITYYPFLKRHYLLFIYSLFFSLILGGIPIGMQAQFIHDIEYKVDREKLNILYLMDAVPSIHRPGWSYNLSVKVEGKILGRIQSTGISGDYLGVVPNEFQKMITWEVDNKDESLSDNLKVSLTVQDMDGPKAALKSLLIPGTGLKFVTGRNQIGLLRTFSVYTFLAGGIGTSLLSRVLYDNYLNSKDEIFMNSYGEANFFHQASIVCFAAGIGIWTWDVLNTAARGRRNLKHLYKPVKVTPLVAMNGTAGMQLNWRIGR
jgi:hypothetical protein